MSETGIIERLNELEVLRDNLRGQLVSINKVAVSLQGLVEHIFERRDRLDAIAEYTIRKLIRVNDLLEEFGWDITDGERRMKEVMGSGDTDGTTAVGD